MAQRASGNAGPLAVETVLLRDQPILCVLLMEKCAVRLWQGAATPLLAVIIFPCDHQRLFLSHLLLLEDFPHEVPFVHRGSDDFQVIGVDDYLPKVYNRWRLSSLAGVSLAAQRWHAGRCDLVFLALDPLELSCSRI